MAAFASCHLENKAMTFKNTIFTTVSCLLLLGFGAYAQESEDGDNAEGRGDHRHYRDTEKPYRFKSLNQLVADFYEDIDPDNPLSRYTPLYISTHSRKL